MSLASKLTDERRSRLAAERLLELKQAELFAANRKLGKHAQQLTEEIVETRAEVETIRGENQRVKSDLSVAHEKIAITERRLWHSIQTINDGFAFFNPDNEMIMANKAYLAVFDGLADIKPGVNYVTILQALTDEGIVNCGDMRPVEWREKMHERFKQTAPEPMIIRLWNGNFIKLVDQRGPEGDMVSLGLDITATVHNERQLREAREIAETANRAKSAFLANMSHEIRTPMNGVIGMADVLTDTQLSAEQQLYVTTIKNSGEALLVIINDVLDYSKIEAKKLDLHPETFDLKRAIQEVIMLLQPSARDKGLSLLLDYNDTLPVHLVADPGRIRQVLTNLMGNAVKFTNDGKVQVNVTGVPGAQQGDITVQITIQDTGIGIPENMVGHIFGEFNQVENERNRQFDGTGLGLAISQRLIELMGGDIWVTSQEGKGSCFGFTVPMTAPSVQPARLPIPAGAQSSDQPTTDLSETVPRQMRILAAEDNKTNQLVFRKMLKTLDIDLVFAANGEEAVAQYQTFQPDLIFMDISMPKMDGKEATRAIRKLEQNVGTHVPIVALTAHAMDGDETGIMAAGLDHYLTKPLRKALIMKQIADAQPDAARTAIPDELVQEPG